MPTHDTTTGVAEHDWHDAHRWEDDGGPPLKGGATSSDVIARLEAREEVVPDLWKWGPGQEGEQRIDSKTGYVFLWSPTKDRWLHIGYKMTSAEEAEAKAELSRPRASVGKDAPLADSNFATGAVRSADVEHLDFCSSPLLGFLGVLRVAGCGGTKYGRFNYHKGMPVHQTINHAIVHVIRWLLGDRTEPHLAKAAWGLMVADQTVALQPELCDPHVLGPGATVTPSVDAELERGKAERDARRQASEFEELFAWTLADMPEVQAIIRQRKGAA